MICPVHTRLRGGDARKTVAAIWVGVLCGTMQPALAARADGGYEGDRLPAAEGWVEAGSCFLGDYVTVANGIMTYDGSADPAPGACGMQFADSPLKSSSWTIEYRVRCRAIGGDPDQWYKAFLAAVFYNDQYGLSTFMGRYQGTKDQGHEIRTTLFKPENAGATPPPTSTGTWNTNEWVTVRHLVRDLGRGKCHVESWVGGPAGESKYLGETKAHPGMSPTFELQVYATTSHGAVFDLDYLRWVHRVVPWGTPIVPADRAPAVLSIRPNSGSQAGGTLVTIRGSNFSDGTTVTFGGARAGRVNCADRHNLTCTAPRHSPVGWVDVIVRNAEGSETAREGFFYGILPRVEGVEPDRGANSGGQTTTIRGKGFQPGARVRFGSTTAQEVKVIESRSITCRTPATPGRWRGAADVSVTNPDGGRDTKEELFTFERSAAAEPKLLGWLLELHDFNLSVAVQKLQEMPFHGVILRPDCALGLHNGKTTQEDVDRDTATIKATDFRRFTHNFLYASFRGRPDPSLGFFEDWTGVIAGYRRYARMAKDLGFKGFWLDFEDYAGGRGADLGYHTRNDKSKSSEDCKARVRLRARQIMLAVLSEFPDIKLITTFGLGAGTHSSLDLLPSFIDGLLEAVDSDEAYAGAKVIDGYEEGYYITTPDDFRRAYDRMRKPGGTAYGRTGLDQAWADHGAAGFGVYAGGRTVADFRAQLASAMEHADQYIWVYTNGSFFSFNNVPHVGKYRAKDTDRFVQVLMDATGHARATPVGRHQPIAHWRMEEGEGTTASDSSRLGFRGRLSDDDLWTRNAPSLPTTPGNNWALDFRGGARHVRIARFGYTSRSSSIPSLTPAATGSHLGNLYFADHTIEFSFWWDGELSGDPQYLYGADGGGGEAGQADTFVYGGWIPPGTRKLVHWQRGNYGTEHGGIEIDLEGAQAAGVYRFSQWAHVAVGVRGIESRNWRIFLSGEEVAGTTWAGVHGENEAIGGFRTPFDGKWRLHAFLVDLVIGARNADELGIVQPFNGMLDEFRISAGQVPARDLLSAPTQP